MSLWGKTDAIADVPKSETPIVENTRTIDASNVSVVVLATDKIVEVAHGFVTGDIVLYSTGGGTAITPLVNGNYYYVIALNADEFQLAATDALATAGTQIVLTVVGVGAAHVFEKSTYNMFFIDTTEAAVASNNAKGIKTPGWNKYTTYVDSNGNTRHRVESMVAMKVTAASAGDLGVTGVTAIEDETVADS
ncbi:MAG: hypothetical protein COA84_13440 [Robiginitomaculum sp.]|nr:MAG: hypothetical protein COA84_13440 [Robiginitomaculum sp.]